MLRIALRPRGARQGSGARDVRSQSSRPPRNPKGAGPSHELCSLPRSVTRVRLPTVAKTITTTLKRDGRQERCHQRKLHFPLGRGTYMFSLRGERGEVERRPGILPNHLSGPRASSQSGTLAACGFLLSHPPLSHRAGRRHAGGIVSPAAWRPVA